MESDRDSSSSGSSADSEELPPNYVADRIAEGVKRTIDEVRRTRQDPAAFARHLFQESAEEEEEEGPETAPTETANAGPCPTPTPVSKLPVKPQLPKDLAIKCRVTFVRNPSDFNVRPVSEEEGPEPEEGAVGGMISQGLAVSSRLDRRLNASLSMDTEFHYKKLQVPSYLLRSEVVAVRIPTPDGRWNRAVMYSSHISDVNSLVPPSGRCQLLDTGEWVEVMLSEVCRLPEQFCDAHAAAYRCKLFRVSARDGGWEENGVRIYKELVEGKEVMVTFKERFGAEPDLTRVMERYPYVVKVLVDETGTGETWTDVAQKLIDSPLTPAVEWDLALSMGRARPVLKVPGRGVNSSAEDSSDSHSSSVASDQTIASSVAPSGPNPFWRVVDWLTKNDFLGEGPLLPPANQGDEGANGGGISGDLEGFEVPDSLTDELGDFIDLDNDNDGPSLTLRQFLEQGGVLP